MTEPVRIADRLAGGVASTFGAGLFLGLAPASSISGWWLVAGTGLAAALAVLFALSTPEHVSGPVAPALGVLGRLCAAVATAGTFGTYVLGDHPQVGAVGLVVVVTAVVVLAPPLPPFVARVAAGLVLAVLLVVAVACFTIAPEALAVAPPSDSPGLDNPLGLLPAAALLYVCFTGALSGGPTDRRERVGVLVIVLAVCLAVAVGALRQLGGQRLALSRAPLLDALAAADATSLTLLLALGVTVGCAFSLRGILSDVRDQTPAGRPPVVAVVLAAGLTALGVLFVQPTHALVGAAVLLLGEAGYRVLAGRRGRA